MSAEALASLMQQTVTATKQGSAAAFIEETGLKPSEAVMYYGVVTVDGRSRFKVWFERNEGVDELEQLRSLTVRVAKGEECLVDAAKLLLTVCKAIPVPKTSSSIILP